MNDQLAERLCVALEQLALELAEVRERGQVPQPVFRAVTTPAVLPVLPEPVTFAPLDTWRCPVHGTVKTVPAGVSARTGQAYAAFMACPEYGCPQKPPRAPTRVTPQDGRGQQLP